MRVAQGRLNGRLDCHVYTLRSCKGNNPKLAIAHALKKAGVKMVDCFQALVENSLPDAAVDPGVTITLSALTDVVIYGKKDNIYMRL